MAIIADIYAKGKALLGRIPEGTLTTLIVLLACSGSFGLGALYGQDTRKGEVTFQEIPQVNQMPTAASALASSEEPLPPMAAGGQYVASKSGKSYHLPWCGGAKQIKEENKIWFATKEEAEAKGYAPAKNCKGI